MAWSVDKNTLAVNMHRGDTGAYYVQMTGSYGPYEDGDVAIYEVKSGSEILIYREFNLQPEEPNIYELGDGKFLIAFLNSTTDRWPAGTYATEIRVARHPVRNLKVAMVVDSGITAEIDEDICLAYVEEVSGTVVLEYTTDWSADPADYGITITGTPDDGDTITVSWNKDGDGRVKDGNNVRTVVKSSITINDVIIEI